MSGGFLEGLIRSLFGAGGPPSGRVTRVDPQETPSWKRFAAGPPSDDYVGRVTTARQSLLDDDYRRALTAVGLAKGTDVSVAFLKAALKGVDWPKGIALRKFGDQISREELKDLGYRPNLILTHQCWEILTDEGRKDPVHSTQAIVSEIEARSAHLRKMGNARLAVGNDAMIQVYANNMASGPCSACTALAANPVPLSLAPSGPLPSCPHPDQCALHWRTIYSPD